MRKRVRIKVEYRLLDGTKIQKTKTLPTQRIEDEFPLQFMVGHFISQSAEEPQGMFIISGVNIHDKKIMLNAIDCDPIHWKPIHSKGDGNRRGYGPDNDCAKKKCPHLKGCPISTYVIMMVDID